MKSLMLIGCVVLTAWLACACIALNWIMGIAPEPSVSISERGAVMAAASKGQHASAKDVLREPAKYTGRLIAVRGTVDAVCNGEETCVIVDGLRCFMVRGIHPRGHKGGQAILGGKCIDRNGKPVLTECVAAKVSK